jgi:putative polyhydroxyalkanoate system protein
MPKVNIEQPHNLPLPEVKQRLEQLKTKFAEKYGIDGVWKNDREVEIKRTGASGSITCAESSVKVFLDLSFALSPLKGKIEERIKQALADALK